MIKLALPQRKQGEKAILEVTQLVRQQAFPSKKKVWEYLVKLSRKFRDKREHSDLRMAP